MSTTFKIGDRVALPQVGVGCIVGIGRTAFGSSDQDFYQIQLDRDTSITYIPTDIDPAERGLRRVMTPKQARQAVDILATPSCLISDAEWRKTIRERVKCGGVDEQAALIRDLQARLTHRRLTSQEKAFLEKAQNAIIAEMVEALRQPAEEIRDSVIKALQAGVVLVPESVPPSD